jgi:hypothetical protein
LALEFSDPDRLPPLPPHTIGFPDRSADADAKPGFVSPPPGHGEVAFYWWLGDPLQRERIAWQIQQLAGRSVAGLQVNYAHSDQGGRFWGLSYPSEPALFSEDWWELYGWFLQESKRNGMAVSLSDYTLGIGQGSFMDDILRDNPELNGATLRESSVTHEGGAPLEQDVPKDLLSVTAFLLEDGVVRPGSGRDLSAHVSAGRLRWPAPQGTWKVVSVAFVRDPVSLDPMHPLSGVKYIEKFFQRFENRNPGESGKGLNFFFSDELNFGVGGNLWTDGFADEFRARKGYDLLPELAALFMDIGPRTPKVRLDYSDVLVALEEERFFRPCFDWHYERGMTYGCDHGGRGRDLTEFGDYFRTQRWMTGPGCDQPNLEADIVKNKVASSIAHLYLRPRTWLEGFHSSGWGTTSAQVVDATFRNFVGGHNLLTLHGLYYSTHGGWWEWAPPCNHFRMPYWDHLTHFMRCSERLSYLLSQGHHRCDVAILYPVATLEAGLMGHEAVGAAFGLGEHLFKQGIDFDYMDFQSLDRAQVRDGQLHVSGEVYRVLVLPAMRGLRFSTLQKAVEFYRGGGLVVALGALPEASDRIGRNDPELDACVKELFGARGAGIQHNTAGGTGVFAQQSAEVEELINRAFPRDFRGSAGAPQVLHRRIGPRDVYMVYGAPRHSECTFRAQGKVERWDPWTGQTQPLPVLSQGAEGTRLRMPLDAGETQLIVFSPGQPEIACGAADAGAPAEVVPVDGDWEFELKPTMDNTWGDFRWPPTRTFIGAEMRQPRYADETTPNPGWQDPALDDSSWPRTTASFGPMFWKLGPLPDAADASALEAHLAALQAVDPSVPVQFNGGTYAWQPYSFSWRWSLETDPGHQGYHGLKEETDDGFIALGKLDPGWKGDPSYGKEEPGSRYYLWSSVVAQRSGPVRASVGGLRPASVWINHARVDGAADQQPLRAGANPLLLRYDAPGRGFFVLEAGEATRASDAAGGASPTSVRPLAMSWYTCPGLLPFDLQPQVAQPAGWYRFCSPPGLRAMTIIAHGSVRAWADGRELTVEAAAARRADGSREFTARVPAPSAAPARVAVRIEQDRGCYGGAALPEPIALDCGAGLMPLGDWAQLDGLRSYSGGAWYRKTVALTAAQARAGVTLQLGQLVSSAEVQVNGRPAGVRVAPPWEFDLSGLLVAGPNRIEILVYNTLSNHYTTIPTRYRGSTVSGLLGPVRLELRRPHASA